MSKEKHISLDGNEYERLLILLSSGKKKLFFHRKPIAEKFGSECCKSLLDQSLSYEKWRELYQVAIDREFNCDDIASGFLSQLWKSETTLNKVGNRDLS